MSQEKIDNLTAILERIIQFDFDALDRSTPPYRFSCRETVQKSLDYFRGLHGYQSKFDALPLNALNCLLEAAESFQKTFQKAEQFPNTTAQKTDDNRKTLFNTIADEIKNFADTIIRLLPILDYLSDRTIFMGHSLRDIRPNVLPCPPG